MRLLIALVALVYGSVLGGCYALSRVSIFAPIAWSFFLVFHPLLVVTQLSGLEVWRIEALAAIKYPETDYGKFFSGDSYIVLKTNKKPNSSALSWDVHFWLGQSSSQDEQGAAALKTVALDDQLGGGPVQHREVQGHESALFTSYFKGGLQYSTFH